VFLVITHLIEPWSRKGKDYTYLYGKHVGVGSLTPFIDAAFDPRVEEYVPGAVGLALI
jgi:hypothetical protein